MKPYISKHCSTPSPFGSVDGKSWSKLFKTRISFLLNLSFSCSMSMEKSSKLMYKDLLDRFDVVLDAVGSLRELEAVSTSKLAADLVLCVLRGVWSESLSLSPTASARRCFRVRKEAVAAPLRCSRRNCAEVAESGVPDREGFLSWRAKTDRAAFARSFEPTQISSISR